MLGTAIILGLLAATAKMESRLLGQQMLDRPIVLGPLVGLIMGDFTTGVIVGGELELIWAGASAIGASIPPDVIVGGILGTAFAIQVGGNIETAFSLAIPIAMLAQSLSVLTDVINSFWIHRADRCAEKGDDRGVVFSHHLGTMTFFLSYFLVVCAGYALGSEVIQTVVDAIPDFINNGLRAVSNFLPCLGVAMLMSLIMDRRNMVYLFIGFGLMAFFGLSIIGAAFVGAVLAVMVFMNSGREYKRG